MNLKVQVDDDGSAYVAAIDPDTGEHRKAATVGKGQEVNIDLSGVSIDAVSFGDVVDSGVDAPGGGNEGSPAGSGDGGEQPPAPPVPPAPPAGDLNQGDGDQGGGDQSGDEAPAPTTSEASEKPLYLIDSDEVPADFAESGLETPEGRTLFHFSGDAAGEPGTGNGDAISIYADADDNEKPVQAVPEAPAS